jgi:hypothetical protein
LNNLQFSQIRPATSTISRTSQLKKALPLCVRLQLTLRTRLTNRSLLVHPSPPKQGFIVESR